jgi:23S rRNA (cytidine1920-2'-O)/16S rRNA (cytidine1409-2'-O)-methyltransferase
VDTSYGTLAWTLRKDPRVVVVERTNAMHVTLPEPPDLVTVDVGWTPQARILPNVERMLASKGQVVSLIKPHYEAPKSVLVGGVLPDALWDEVVSHVLDQIRAMGWSILGKVKSPIPGHGGNSELLTLLERAVG